MSAFERACVTVVEEEVSVGEWTWLHHKFPLADLELMSPPIPAQVANVLVRTIRVLPTTAQTESVSYEVRVAPHNVAKFRGGPWLHVFREDALRSPGAEIDAFREALWVALQNLQEKQ
jgi:hypothetical protein